MGLMATFYAERAIRASNALLPFATKRSGWSWRPWRRVALRTEQLRLELALPRAVAAAEDFLLMRATEKLRPSLLQPVAATPGADPVRQRLRDARKNFEQLKGVWLHEFGVDIEALSDWSAFERWRDLRHILVHRLGYWQPALDPQPRLKDRIRSLGEDPDLYRGLVPLAAQDVSNAVSTTNRLVLDADGRCR